MVSAREHCDMDEIQASSSFPHHACNGVSHIISHSVTQRIIYSSSAFEFVDGRDCRGI